MFIKKNGPEGFEFPSCSECNRSTALSEHVAAFYIRTFDTNDKGLDGDDLLKLVNGVANNAPESLPKFSYQRGAVNPLIDPAGIMQRSMTIPPMAAAYIRLFALKVLYAIYYKTTGRFACSSNRYLLDWAQYGTEAAITMNNNADAWFDQNVVGARRNIDLGDQFTYQSGYNPQHGFFGLKMNFAKAFVVFGVVGPARDLRTLKPPLPFCPAILDAAKKVRKEKRAG